MFKRRAALLGLLFFLCAVPSAFAQATGTINGRVVDQADAVLPGVTISLKNSDTGATRTTVTNGQGVYSVPALDRGIYEMVMLIHKMGKRVIISENGVQDPTDAGIAPEFMVRHLIWLTRAIRDGANVLGYFYWTLMDNYEWHLGVDFRMGLFAVDNASPNKSRSARKTVEVYRRIAQEGKIPADLVTRYPEPEKK